MNRITQIFFAAFFIPGAQGQNSTVTLDECIRAALINNPEIKEYKDQESISAVAVGSAKASYFPGVSFGASAGFSNEYSVKENYRTGSAGLSANQIIWQRNKLQAVTGEAKYLNQAAKASLDAKRNELIFSVKKAFFFCLQQQELAEISKENVIRAELFSEYAKERFRVGAGRKSDILKAESDLSEARVEYYSLMNSNLQAKNFLEMLTGIKTEFLSESGIPEPVFLQFSENSIDSLLSVSYRFYPELKKFENMVLSQEFGINRSRAELYPRLDLNAGYRWNYNAFSDEQQGWYSLITVRWDLFTGKERKYRITTGQLQKSVLENRIEYIKNDLKNEIRNRIINIREAQDRIDLTNRMIETTSANLDIALAQYLAGTGSLLELTDVRMANFSAKMQNIMAKTTWHTAVADLDQLIGNNNEYLNYDE